MPRLAVLAVVFLLTSTLTGAARPADQEPTPAELVRDLGSPSYAAREKASRGLWKLGPVARPALEEAARSSDPEVRTRAEEVIARIHRQTANRKLLEAPASPQRRTRTSCGWAS